MTYDGQARIDARGLSRQFFTDLFMVSSTAAYEIPALLERWNGQKLIAYNPAICSCDLIETFQKITAHSIMQTDLGLSCLIYAIYYYICTGKIEIAVPYLTIAEVPYHQSKECLTQLQAIYYFFSYFLWKIFKKIVPIFIAIVILFELSSLIHKVSLFLLGEFLAEIKFHVIKANHEIKYLEKVGVYIYNT